MLIFFMKNRKSPRELVKPSNHYLVFLIDIFLFYFIPAPQTLWKIFQCLFFHEKGKSPKELVKFLYHYFLIRIFLTLSLAHKFCGQIFGVYFWCLFLHKFLMWYGILCQKVTNVSVEADVDFTKRSFLIIVLKIVTPSSH